LISTLWKPASSARAADRAPVNCGLGLLRGHSAATGESLSVRLPATPNTFVHMGDCHQRPTSPLHQGRSEINHHATTTLSL
jgi:hypothetical protein